MTRNLKYLTDPVSAPSFHPASYFTAFRLTSHGRILVPAAPYLISSHVQVKWEVSPLPTFPTVSWHFTSSDCIVCPSLHQLSCPYECFVFLVLSCLNFNRKKILRFDSPCTGELNIKQQIKISMRG